MRILRVAGDLYPAFVGGIAIHADELSKMQAQSGNDVTVCTSIWKDEPEEEYREGYRIMRFKGIKLFRNSISPRLFFYLMRERRAYDVIHAHSHLYFSTVLSAIVRKIGSSPLVVTDHGLISQTAPMWLQRLYIPTIARWVYNTADGVICYTGVEKKQLIDLGVRPEKISVIHNGVNTGHFLPSPNIQKKKQILWIGKYVPGKGVEFLLHGFKTFSEKYPDYTLMMIGRGPLKDYYFKLIKELEIEDKIALKDFAENRDLPEIYQQSCVFVLPSLEEGVPRTILEAMSCGVPVACTKLPQLVNIVTGCGLLFNIGDSGALANALITLISESSMAQTMGRAGREKAVSYYSWADTVEITTRLFNTLVEEERLEVPRKYGEQPSSQARG